MTAHLSLSLSTFTLSLSLGAYYGAAVLFAALLGLKHLFLTLAPFVTTYLFAVHVVADCDSLLDGCLRLSRLGARTACDRTF